MERSGKVKDYLSGKKFVNKITQDAITAKMCEALGADESKARNSVFKKSAQKIKNKQ